MSSDHPWFAVHDDVLYDPKLARVRRCTRLPRLVVLGAWTAVLALSNQSPVRGVLLIREDRPLSTRELFDEWDIDDDDAAALLNALVDQGMLHQEGEAWVVCNWDKRQPRLDKSTERVKRWRERQKTLSPLADETNETLYRETDETFRNGIEGEEELEREGEREGDEGGGGEADEYGLETRLAQIVQDGVHQDVGARPRSKPKFDPGSDDEAAITLWNRVLAFCGNSQSQAKAIFLVARDLEVELEWVKPIPTSEYEERVAMSDWWRPIKRALETRKWDAEITGKAMVAAAKAMYQRELAPSKPSALIGEMSKQKVTKPRASPSAPAGDGTGGAGGVEAIREKIRQKRGQNDG